MKAPLSWLRDYAPLDASVDQLTTVLSELGLVVDGVEEVGGGLADVVVARVLDIRPHPDADRIRLVDVDPGDGGPLQIVCGAWNFNVGDLVPLAPIGAVLPGDFKIAKRKMRGEVSNGMLCAARELELPEPPDATDGLLILAPDLAPPGTPIADALGIEADVVFDLDITPNRPDALCMAGIARDLAAALGETWSWPATSVAAPDPALGAAPVTVSAGDLCPRFTATVMEGLPTGPSPEWMARRLTLAGMRPINAVVDASNYVMLDLGQPNHAYDLAQLGGGGILVRRGVQGETLVTLDDVARALGPDDCVICDADGTAVGVGGIMGGASAEIGPDTQRVLLECAWFDPTAIARTGNRLGLTSEARTRFERGVDPGLAERAATRFFDLLRAIPGGENLRRGPLVDERDPSLPAGPELTLRTARVNEVLGVDLSDSDVAGYLEPLGFAVAGDRVTVPTWRLEVAREIDLIEEVARMYGYRRIARTVPAGSGRRTGGLTTRQRERRRIRAVLGGAGLDEAWTTTFLAPGDLDRAGLDPAAVEVENPLDRSESLLRTSLMPGLLKALRFNLDRQLDDLALFEIGRVFRLPAPGSVLPEEEELLGVAVLPPAGASLRSSVRPSADAAVVSAVRSWQWLASALRLDSPALVAGEVAGLHRGRSARAFAGRVELGAVGEVDPDVVSAYELSGRVGWVSLSLDALAGVARRPRLVGDISRYPASDVDLAFVVDEAVPAADVVAAVRSAGGDLVEDVTLFDVYRGERVGAGVRSLALRARFRALDRTLTDTELADLRQGLIDAAAGVGATLRS
ncbi:MAG TPA: phenylalanine--tRNA ligase subunit beta [Acidimicrobiales bacterium]|nr:phenylalanine--tRNA ligase subunit beta [Acidimicrobiales bacterium]